MADLRRPAGAGDRSLVRHEAIEPIWATKTETASRLRGRIENILDWAATRGYRKGDNPARWRGHLENLLPKRTKVRKVQHHAALSYAHIGAFMHALQQQQGVAAMALAFCILTTTRTSETIGARWEEVDLNGAVWTIPAERISKNRRHLFSFDRCGSQQVEGQVMVRDRAQAQQIATADRVADTVNEFCERTERQLVDSHEGGERP